MLEHTMKLTIPAIFKISLSFLILGIFLQLLKGAAISSLLLMHVGFSDIQSLYVEKVFAISFLVLGIFSVWRSSQLNLFSLSLLILFISLTSFFAGGKHFSELSVFAHFTRIVLPLAYLYYLRKQLAICVWLLRLGIAFTFATHGWEALQANPVFIDYLIGFFQLRIQEHTASYMLIMVGIVDIVVAFCIWKVSNLWAIYWVVFWGFLTASLRVYDAGLENFSEFLVRTPNFCAGLLLLAIVRVFFNKSEVKRNLKTS